MNTPKKKIAPIQILARRWHLGFMKLTPAKFVGNLFEAFFFHSKSKFLKDFQIPFLWAILKTGFTDKNAAALLILKATTH